MAYPIGKYIIVPFFNLWLKQISGIENLPPDAFIIAANHSSYMDHPLIVGNIVKHKNRKVHFLSKKEHFDTTLKAIWHRYAGAIPLDRQRGGKLALKKAVKILKEGKIIAIHPEGTRSLDGKLMRAKTGIARLSLAAKVPVVPVGLIGTFEILPKGKYIPRMKRAIIHIGKPMYFGKYYRKPVTKRLLREITTKIMKEIAKLSNKKYEFD
ncbi:MAG TPA: lysophospholipid acyltransferase family protein [Candidatus Nanoarchaeia archaeon]|nr:lysophospholipid acyltransferase family protein [Candidatus Nanoarchaeia archaeon]